MIFPQTQVHCSFLTRSTRNTAKNRSLFFIKGMIVAPLSTAGVSDEVAQELQMPMGPQMLEDVEEPMPSRPATLRDPGTPDQIVEQHSLTHFPSQPWCKMCVESRGRVSPHREQSKIDAVPQLQWYIGVEAICRLRVSSWEQTPLLEPYSRQRCQILSGWTCPAWLMEQPSGCVTWSVNAFVHTETK